MRKITSYTFLLTLSVCAFANTPDSAKPSVICEGEKGWLQCQQYQLIKIDSAFWGRSDHSTCPKVPAGLVVDRLCEANAENTRAKINGQCKNEQACELVASNIFFDDNSCGNVYKYLEVSYQCIADEANAVDVLK